MSSRLIKFYPYLIIFLSTTYLVRFSLEKLGSVNLLDILILIFLFFFAQKIYEDNQQFDNFKKYLKNKIIPLLLLITMFLGISFSFLKNMNQHSFDSLGIIKSYFFLPILFAITVGFLIKSKATRLSICVFSYFSSASIISIFGIIYIIFRQLTFDGRLRIFFESPNQLAFTLAPGIIIGFFYLLKKKVSLAWIISLFFTITQAFCLWKTASLGVWIGIFTAFLFILSVHFKIWGSKKFFISILLLSFISISLIVNIAKISIIKDFFKNTGSTSSRLVIYRTSSKIFKENYLFGIGLGNFQEKYLMEQKNFPPYPQWAVPHSHNLFFHLWLETGLLSFLSLLILIIYQGVIKKQKKMPLLLGAILVYFFTHGIFDVVIWKNDSALFFWFILLSV